MPHFVADMAPATLAPAWLPSQTPKTHLPVSDPAATAQSLSASAYLKAVFSAALSEKSWQHSGFAGLSGAHMTMQAMTGRLRQVSRLPRVPSIICPSQLPPWKNLAPAGPWLLLLGRIALCARGARCMRRYSGAVALFSWQDAIIDLIRSTDECLERTVHASDEP